MSAISALLPLLGNPSANRNEIVGHMYRLDENFACSNAEATALWNTARRTNLRALELQSLSIAILSNTTQEFLLPFLYAAGFACGLDLRVFWAGAGRIADLVIAPDSRFHASEPELVFLSYDQEQALGGVLYETLNRQERLRAARGLLEEVGLMVERITTTHPATKIVVHTFHWFHPSVVGFIDAARTEGPSDVTDFLNEELRLLARRHSNLHLLDMQRLVGTVGFSRWRNNNRWFGESVDTVSGNQTLAREYFKFIKSFTKRSRKVIVVDLDNTLWGGLVGEEGPGGVVLGGGYPGNAFQQFQRVLKLYSERGVLLAINSKNNRGDAMAVIERHSEMVLRPHDFVAMEINWDDKATNMARLAEQLNLGLNSFVFIDDSPQERELIRQSFPEVLVPEFPSQIADLPYVLAQLNDFDYESFTDTDRQRTRMYRTESLRRSLKTSATSMADYLAALEMKMKISRASNADLGRLEQMFQRTNQFNTTARRYSLSELSNFVESEDCALVLGSVEDKFGDHGIVAAALVKFGSKAIVDSFLMSCRVIGRGVESALLAHLADISAERGYEEMHAEFVPNRKNEPSHDLFVQHGFVSEKTTESSEIFVLPKLRKGRLRVPDHMTMREADRE